MIASLWTRVARCTAHVRSMLVQHVGLGGDPRNSLPLLRLMEDAEPPPDLLDRIESELDADTGSITGRTVFSRRLVFGAFTLGLGVLIGIAAMQMIQIRVPVHATGADGASAGVLGHLGLHGASIRVGVRELCQDADHLAISITAKKRDQRPGQSPHVDVPRKFLIPCNL